MFGAAIIVFRETIEAALIVGIVAAATRGLPARNAWLAGGIGAGLAGALIVAALAGNIAEWAAGAGQELLNAVILGLAAAMLAWHNIWMASHGRTLAHDARSLGQDVVAGQREMSALGLVVMLAIMREGSETALFIYGLMTGSAESAGAVLAGGALGLLAGALAGAALYAGFVRIPMRWFFAATGALVTLLAAAMASQAAYFLVQADLLPELAHPLWDTSALLPNGSLAGRALHTLVGYEAMPSGIQVVFYVATFLAIVAGMSLTTTRPAPRAANQP
jgi:high-affinity iron transporter